MSLSKKWEVSLYADFPKGIVMRKNFKSIRKSRRFVRKVLGKDEEIYCATIWHEDTSLFYTFYWNGTDIIYWDKPWVLSCRQARNLELNNNGNIVVRPFKDKQD